MKKTIRLLAVIMIVATLSVLLISCGKTLSGTYSREGSFLLDTKESYTFKGSSYTKTSVTSVGSTDMTTTEEGKYEIKEDPENADQLVIVFTTTKDDTTVTNTYSFSEGEENDVKYIKINGVKYEKN